MRYTFALFGLYLAILLAVVFYLSGCDTLNEASDLDKARLELHKQADWTTLAIDTKADWNSADIHINEVLKSIKACDEGIAHLNYAISHQRSFSLLAEMHVARSSYLEVRAILLLQLYTLSPIEYGDAEGGDGFSSKP